MCVFVLKCEICINIGVALICWKTKNENTKWNSSETHATNIFGNLCVVIQNNEFRVHALSQCRYMYMYIYNWNQWNSHFLVGIQVFIGNLLILSFGVTFWPILNWLPSTLTLSLSLFTPIPSLVHRPGSWIHKSTEWLLLFYIWTYFSRPQFMDLKMPLFFCWWTANFS